MQPVHRIGKGGLLVVHRDYHVEHGNPGGAGREGRVRPGFEGCGQVTFEAMSVMTPMVDAQLVFSSGAKLCARYEFCGASVRS